MIVEFFPFGKLSNDRIASNDRLLYIVSHFGQVVAN